MLPFNPRLPWILDLYVCKYTYQNRRLSDQVTDIAAYIATYLADFAILTRILLS